MRDRGNAEITVVAPRTVSKFAQLAFVADQTVVAMSRDRVQVEPDQTIWLTPQRERVYLFNEQGRRIAGS